MVAYDGMNDIIGCNNSVFFLNIYSFILSNQLITTNQSIISLSHFGQFSFCTKYYYLFPCVMVFDLCYILVLMFCPWFILVSASVYFSFHEIDIYNKIIHIYDWPNYMYHHFTKLLINIIKERAMRNLYRWSHWT